MLYFFSNLIEERRY